MTDWMTANTAISYPFEDDVAYDSALTPIVDAVISAREGAYSLSALSDSNVTLVDENNDIAIDKAWDTVVAWGDYTIYTAFEDDIRIQLVAEQTPLPTFVGTAHFVTRVHEYGAAGVQSFNDEVGQVTIEFDQNFTITETAETITISCNDPQDRVTAPSVDYLTQLGGVRPDASGSVNFVGDDCYRVTAGSAPHSLVIKNLCTPCCECEEFYDTYKKLYSVDDSLCSAIRNTTESLDRHNRLVSYMVEDLNVPCEPVPDPGVPTFAHSFVGGPTHCNSLSAIARLVPVKYGATLNLTITNGFQDIEPLADAAAQDGHDPDVATSVSGLEVVVRTRNTYRSSTGQVLLPQSVGGSYDFPGFPGGVLIGTLDGLVSCTVISEFYEQGLVGEPMTVEVIITATRDADDEELSMVLNLSLDEIEGGINLASGPNQPTGSDGRDYSPSTTLMGDLL